MISWQLVPRDGIVLDSDALSDPAVDLRRIFLRCLAGVDTLVPFDLEEAVSALMTRELMIPTASGGIAFPHAGIQSLSTSGIVVIGRFEPAIQWPGTSESAESTRVAVTFLFPKWMGDGGYLRAHSQVSKHARTLLPQMTQTDDFEEFVTSEFKAHIDISWRQSNQGTI